MLLSHSSRRYVIFGIRAQQPAGDPYPAGKSVPGTTSGYNTAVILDRQGKIVGSYQKQFPCCPAPDPASGVNWNDDGFPSRKMAQV